MERARAGIIKATALAGALAALAGCGSSGGSGAATAAPRSAAALAPIHGPYAPRVEPSDFVARVNNPYWPLRPGTTFFYRGVRNTTPQTDTEVVTRRTKRILGIPCTVVRDTVAEAGHPVERTFDWYAQDTQGNVWYMGENSLEKAHGHFVRASDSWRSGVDGAKPGVIMPAAPRPGDAYRQEYYPPGEALDEARVLRLDGSARVPYGSFGHVLVTSERSPLEPQTEQKYYARGVGEVRETVVKGHHEAFRLVDVRR